MSKYKPKAGDRVRVVLEGEVDSEMDESFRFEDGKFYTGIAVNAPFVVSIEKIEPPITTFKPGQTVRRKVTGLCYSLATDGYLSHESGYFHKYGPGIYNTPTSWTSDRYEAVDL